MSLLCYLFQDPRQLTATIVRFGGVIGTISVGYRVLYFPPGVTDASQGQSGILTGATGSVRLGAGEGSASIVVNISSEALLEPESNFYVNITDVMLTEGEYMVGWDSIDVCGETVQHVCFYEKDSLQFLRACITSQCSQSNSVCQSAFLSSHWHPVLCAGPSSSGSL